MQYIVLIILAAKHLLRPCAQCEMYEHYCTNAVLSVKLVDSLSLYHVEHNVHTHLVNLTNHSL